MASITTRIGLADHGRAMTLDDFLEAEEEPGYRYELARGVLEVTQVPDDPHGQVVWNLTRIVAAYDLAFPGVILRAGGGNEFQLLLSRMASGRNPDFSLALQGASTDDRGRSIPVLVAEVVSESSVDRDDRVKSEEYLAYGVLGFWIIDLKLRKLTLLVRHEDNWVERRCLTDQPIPSLVLVGLTATVNDLWISFH